MDATTAPAMMSTGVPDGTAGAGAAAPAPQGGPGDGSDGGDGGDGGDTMGAGDPAANDAPPANEDGSAMPPEPTSPSPGPFPAVDDLGQPGPFTATTLSNVGPNGNYAVYMPQEPPPEGLKYPLVAWTSGGGTSHVGYTLLPHLASHGFVVISSNTIPGIGAEAQLGQEIVAGIDWAIAEDSRAGSQLEARVDATRVASSGYSMGSLATFSIADDPRLVTTVHISGGSMAPGAVDALHAPAAFICGIPDPACTNLLSATCDIAAANCATDFEAATTPVFYATFQSGHLGILTPPFTERINTMATQWLRYQLMDDTTLAALFRGASCEYCSDPDWTIQSKQLD
jgi:hypothetical protein